MKLISMTDFVIETLEKEVTVDYGASEKIMEVFRYANSIKQFLEIWMFVPCKLVEGVWVVLEVPIYNGVDDQYYGAQIEQYEQAKEKVLFEGFNVKNNTVKIAYNSWLEFHFFNFSNGNKEVYLLDFSVENTEMRRVYTIEDLVKYKLELINKQNYARTI